MGCLGPRVTEDRPCDRVSTRADSFGPRRKGVLQPSWGSSLRALAKASPWARTRLPGSSPGRTLHAMEGHGVRSSGWPSPRRHSPQQAPKPRMGEPGGHRPDLQPSDRSLGRQGAFRAQKEAVSCFCNSLQGKSLLIVGRAAPGRLPHSGNYSSPNPWKSTLKRLVCVLKASRSSVHFLPEDGAP